MIVVKDHFAASIRTLCTIEYVAILAQHDTHILIGTITKWIF